MVIFIAKWSKMVKVRFDFHPTYGTFSNHHLQRIKQEIYAFITTKYKGIQFNFLLEKAFLIDFRNLLLHCDCGSADQHLLTDRISISAIPIFYLSYSVTTESYSECNRYFFIQI